MFVQAEDNIWDCLIVGGGLAGGLLLQALRTEQPELKVLLLERGTQLGGNHTWSFHGSDVPADATWLQPLISKTWPAYEVRFPRYQRKIQSSYCSIKAQDFHQKLLGQHGSQILLQASVQEVRRDSVTLLDGRMFRAKCVIDARGWGAAADVKRGYQKFVGLDVKLSQPHGLNHVILKDVLVPQVDGYRFVYILPWSETELLVEDTYYSNTPDLDVTALKSGLLDYIVGKGWVTESVIRQEVGCLPLDLYDVPVGGGPSDGPLSLGAASGVYQPVTGYTFPQTVACVQALAKSSLDTWGEVLPALQLNYKKQAHYLRILNRMMFLAAVPEKRYVILERFYQLSEALIERFYQGRLTVLDQVRILCGKPPVSVWRALKSLF
ncbi:lycopene beta-cyclase CrtY [Bdellovibrio bacteriovorus]|uniref:lycopene beta-cyclase CrtY n=1 Tax=Bdellovibrio bacteriovorus TaxID=959 RepID=UPI003AA8BF0C